MIFVALISSFHVSTKWTIYFPQFRSRGLSKKNDHCWELGPGECSLPFFGNLRFVNINKLIFGDIEYRYIFFITQLLKDTFSFFFLHSFNDYCLGMDKTIQRGDLGKNGILFKIVPMHYEMKPSDHNFISCWYKPLPKWLPRAGQSVIPTNLSEFKVGKNDIEMRQK